MADDLVCARSRRTATRGLADCMPRSARGGRYHAGLSTAIEMYRAMEMTFWLPETEAALVQVDTR